MIDKNELRQVLEGYREYFPKHWNDECYKWEAVQHFQTHWDKNADNFGYMFKEATDKADNLLASGYSYPRGMIVNFAKAEDKTVRDMFLALYDETVDITIRVEAFQAKSEELRVKYDDGTWQKHYQSTNAISTYLWLKFPDKYYIYKYEVCRDTALVLGYDRIPKRDGSVQSMLDGYAVYDEISRAVRNDSAICEMRRKVLTASYWPDREFRTTAGDIGFYINRFYLPQKKSKKEGAEWFPKNYSPGLTVDDWVELLQDPSVFKLTGLKIVKRIKDYGGMATCAQLSSKYGESSNFYNGGSVELARRIADKTGCPLLKQGSEYSKMWPVLYVGRKASAEEEGSYTWKLRDELNEALNRTDLSDVPLFEEGAETEMPRNNPESSGDENPLQQTIRMNPRYTKEDFLSEVFITRERYDVLVSLLQNKLNVILQGAPGVGKTFTAKKLAYAMMGEIDDSRVEMVQFHQNYSYEDFVMGYRPQGSDFKLMEGIFYSFCTRASGQPDEKFFFIIDEINRGNMSRIFGELLMMIEKDYRGTAIRLAYDGRLFSVPKNLYIIGMMNTADRSLAMIDYALRRRFSFFEMEPGFHSEGFTRYQKAFANETFDELIEQIKVLNREITEDPSLGRGFQIGHSYFCGREESGCTNEWMRSVVEFDILPMLGEYWFDEPEKLKRWEKNLRGVFDD